MPPRSEGRRGDRSSIYSTYGMRTYRTSRYGTHLRMGAAPKAKDLADVEGIIGFGSSHVDLRSGSGRSRLRDLGDSRVEEIVVWKAA